MTPSLTLSASADRPRRSAAWSTRRARASAQASRIAVPPYSIDWLPEVWPWSGVCAVSPEIILTRASGRSSSSAAICASVVEIPRGQLELAGEDHHRPVGIDAQPGIERAVVGEAPRQFRRL